MGRVRVINNLALGAAEKIKGLGGIALIKTAKELKEEIEGKILSRSLKVIRLIEV